MSRRKSWIALGIALGVLGVFELGVGTVQGAPQEGADPAVAEQLELCAACHESQVTASAFGPHAGLDTDDLWGTEPYGDPLPCSACHGDATTHMDSGGEALDTLFVFGEEVAPLAVNEQCLGCHADTHPRFPSSSHATAGISCTDCHTIHSAHPAGNALLTQVASETAGLRLMEDVPETAQVCIDCHNDVFAHFEFNERHRLQEGILSCVDCHDPHAPQARRLLGAFKQEACIDCHTDKGGPFIFEHGSVQVEGCTSCHTPHGSPNRHMLTFQKTAELCFSCHVGVPQFHFGFNPTAPTRFDLDTVCTNCHSSIHGSNFDPFFLK